MSDDLGDELRAARLKRDIALDRKHATENRYRESRKNPNRWATTLEKLRSEAMLAELDFISAQHEVWRLEDQLWVRPAMVGEVVAGRR